MPDHVDAVEAADPLPVGRAEPRPHHDPIPLGSRAVDAPEMGLGHTEVVAQNGQELALLALADLVRGDPDLEALAADHQRDPVAIQDRPPRCRHVGGGQVLALGDGAPLAGLEDLDLDGTTQDQHAGAEAARQEQATTPGQPVTGSGTSAARHRSLPG
jgi:hypothetical protein